MQNRVNQGKQLFIYTTLVLTVLNAIFGFAWWFSDEDLLINPVVIAVGLSLAYLIVSWRFWDPIKADEMGVRSILGQPFDKVTSGPPFAPLGITAIDIYPTTSPQREFPAEPNRVYFPAEGESDTPPDGSGLVRALRITFTNKPLTSGRAKEVFADHYEFDYNGQKYKFEPGDENNAEDGLASSRVTTVIFHISRFRIFDPIQFTVAVPPDRVTGDRVDEAFRQIEDEQVIALNSILPQMTVAQAMLNVGWINAVLFRKVCRRIGATRIDDTGKEVIIDGGHSTKWGIDLEGAALKPIEFNRGLNKAITGVAQASFDAVSKIRTAEADKAASILAGQAAAQAAKDLEQQTLEGRAAGLVAVSEVLRTEEGRDAQAAEVARSFAAGGNTVLVGTDGLKEILGAVLAAKNVKKEK
jgi:regulator of protease activity HflC (stomatin/prohibitin superfamily)